MATFNALPIGHTFECANAPGIWFKKTGEQTYTEDGEFFNNQKDFTTEGNDFLIDPIGNEEPTVDLVEIPLITGIYNKNEGEDDDF